MLGCQNTHFVNPNGLDDEEHYSTARDLAVITREALRNDLFREIVSTRSRTIGALSFTNHNRLLNECDGVFGVKTGYTEAAGRTTRASFTPTSSPSATCPTRRTSSCPRWLRSSSATARGKNNCLVPVIIIMECLLYEKRIS